MGSRIALGLLIASGAGAALSAPVTKAALKPAAARDCRFTEGWWFERDATNRAVTVRACIAKCEATPRIANFRNAGKKLRGEAHDPFQGKWFDDAVVYKTIEAISCCLATRPDPALKAKLDEWLPLVVAAQEPDGYILSCRTLGAHPNEIGPTRWSRLGRSHELFVLGHLMEAAVAHHAATGERTLLDVATRAADLLVKTFGEGEGQIKNVPGHEEVELALIRLAAATGKGEYRALAKQFIDWRGRPEGRVRCFGEYAQDHQPVAEQREAVGHAVRAAYLYCALADLYAEGYGSAAETLWGDIVAHKLHLTGGIGARRQGEAFGGRDELPNETAYLETCASIGWAFFNARMFLATGEGRYMDCFERTIYNGLVSGVSLVGDDFFYPNPLASRGDYARSKWFDVSCCPGNLARFLPQLPQFLYATRGKDLYWNLFAASEGVVDGIGLKQSTQYPYDGQVQLTLEPPAGRGEFTVYVRIPGWARGRPVPSDLYTQVVPAKVEEVRLAVCGASGERRDVPVKPVAGYVAISRVWQAGDRIELELPMPVRRIRAAERVKADRGRLAVERGPLVWCAEGVDNGGRAFAAALPADAKFGALKPGAWPMLSATSAAGTLTLVPYALWNNRGKGEMQTWLLDPAPRAAEAGVELAEIPPAPVNGPEQWRGIHVAVLGDSLTDKFQTAKQRVWWQYLGAWLDWKVHPHAIPGNQWNALLQQADNAITEKDRGIELKAIFLLAGTNDYAGDVPLGAWFDESDAQVSWWGKQQPGKVRALSWDKTTLRGRINLVLDKLKRAFPEAQIVLMTQPHRAAALRQPDENTANGIGLYPNDYFQVVREASQIWSVPLIDLNADCGLLPTLDEYMPYFRDPVKDRLHPNSRGHLRMATTIYYHLNALPAGF